MTRPLKLKDGRVELAHTRSRLRNVERRIDAERFVPVVFDGLGSELNTGIWGDVPIHIDAVILRWRLIALEVGDLQIDIWKTPFSGFPPTVADTITGSDVPALSSSQKNEDTALTGWTTEVNAGDVLRFNIDSVATITKATLTLALQA